MLSYLPSLPYLGKGFFHIGHTLVSSFWKLADNLYYLFCGLYVLPVPLSVSSSLLVFGKSTPDSNFASAAAEGALVAAACPPTFPPRPGASSLDSVLTSVAAAALCSASLLLGNSPLKSGFSGTCSFLIFNSLKSSAVFSVSFSSFSSIPSSFSTFPCLAPISNTCVFS